MPGTHPPARQFRPENPPSDGEPPRSRHHQPVDEWLSTLFHPDQLDRTIGVLLAAQDDAESDIRRASLRRRIEHASTRIGRHLAAIEAGIDPQTVVTAMNAAQADKASAQVELNNLPTQEQFSEIELRKIIESHGMSA